MFNNWLGSKRELKFPAPYSFKYKYDWRIWNSNELGDSFYEKRN